MSKIAIVEIIGARYREGIFKAMDLRWECDWYFGPAVNGIKAIEPNVLKRVLPIKVSTFVHQPLFWQSNSVGLLFKKCYSTIIIGGELWSVSTWLTLLLNRLTGNRKKIYLWSHGWYGREGKLKQILKRAYFGMATGTLLYGDRAKRLMEKSGFDADKLFVIHNSLNYSAQLKLRQATTPSNVYKEHFGNDYPTLIFIGRLTTAKRIDMILKAAKMLKDKGELYNVMIIGDGAQRESYEQMARDLGVSTWFYGACYDEATNARLLTDADLCVSPGEIGLTAIHSLMFGVPAMTHDDFPYQGPECEAIVDGETGMFFHRDDVGRLADAISSWFEANGHRREEVRRACYAMIDNYWNPDFQMGVLKKIIEKK